jgi:hypothetical protein
MTARFVSTSGHHDEPLRFDEAIMTGRFASTAPLS